MTDVYDDQSSRARGGTRFATAKNNDNGDEDVYGQGRRGGRGRGGISRGSFHGDSNGRYNDNHSNDDSHGNRSGYSRGGNDRGNNNDWDNNGNDCNDDRQGGRNQGGQRGGYYRDGGNNYNQGRGGSRYNDGDFANNDNQERRTQDNSRGFDDSPDNNQGGRYNRGGSGGGYGRNNDDGGKRNNDNQGGGYGGGSRSYRNNGDNDGSNVDEQGGYRGGGRGGRGGSRGGRRGSGGENDDGSTREPNNEGDDGRPVIPKYVPKEIDDQALDEERGISSGINFDKYDNIPVKVDGKDAEPMINMFEELNLTPGLMDNIRKSGYKKPTPIQKHCIPILMDKKDLMATAQTGSGKTAAFVIPILRDLFEKQEEHTPGYPLALIVSPTRELSTQIYMTVRKLTQGTYVKSVNFYGGASSYEQKKQFFNGGHIVVATIGRLVDFMDKGVVKFDAIRFVVLDEADRMLDMGFQQEMRKIINHPTMSSDHQTLMFSATFSNDVQKIAKEFLKKDYVFVTVGIIGGANSDVKQTIYQTSKKEKLEKLKAILDEKAPRGTLVFVETKKTADFVATYLSDKNSYSATSIHGDRTQEQRELALNEFKRGKRDVLVATSVAARGLDIPGVVHVINYDMPKEIDEYVHRIGRTGRVGNTGRATSFFNPEFDDALRGKLATILKDAGQEVPSWLGEDGGSYGGSNSRFGGADHRQSQQQAVDAEEEW